MGGKAFEVLLTVGWVGLEGTLRGHPVLAPAIARDIFHQARLLKGLWTLLMMHTLMCASFQCLNTLAVKNFPLSPTKT